VADSVDAATASMIQNLEQKTGKSMAQWITLVHGMGDLKHGEIVTALKTKHGLTHGYANLVAHSAKGVLREGAPAGEDLVSAQYAGEKQALRPIYDRLLAVAQRFGPDVEAAPKKAYVSLRRTKQFALIQPSTKTRVDVGLQLRGVPAQGRLEASGSFSAMVSHRVKVESVAEVDAELIGWFRKAYDEA
jgi:hypothetical protein